MVDTTATATQIRHRHNFHHQACPPRKVLRSLPLPSLRIILFPREACLFPLLKNVVHEVLTKRSVDFGGLGFVWAGLGCDVLERSSLE